MKKILYSVLALAMTAFTFTSCEDVPAPYPTPEGGEGGQELPEGVYVDESFYNSFGTFTEYTTKGTPWIIDFNTAKGSGYDNASQTTTESESYLVSQEIDLTGSTGAYLQFEYIYRYANRAGAENKVLITDSYTGNPTTTTWEDITGTLVEGSDWNTFTTYARNLDSKYLGKKVVIAFYYACTNNSSTWEVKNVLVADGEVEETPDTPEPPADGVYIDETFASDFGVFTVNEIKGTPWIIDFNTAKASGYDNATGVTTPSESYLVSTPIDLSASEGATIAFEYILRYATNYGEPVPGVSNQVLVTGNYTGDPTTTEWTDITGTLTEGRDWTTFTDYSAAIPTEFIGNSNVVIAFHYTCETSSATWEIKNLTVKEGNGESGGDQPGGGEISGNSITVDVSTLGLEDAVALETVTLADGTTLTFDGGGNRNAPKYYDNGTNIRMYPNNSMTINSTQTIVGIEFTCTETNEGVYNASGDISTTSGTVSTSGNILTVSGASANEITLTDVSTTTSLPSQFRFTKMVIYYAE